MKVRTVYVKPVRTRETFGHVNYGDKPHKWESFQVGVYEAYPDGLRIKEVRRRRGLSLGEAGILLGLRSSVVAMLEAGSRHLAPEVEVEDVIAILEAGG